MSIEIPDACTLPTAERPLRLAEFDTLFAGAVRAVETVAPTHARIRLTGPAGLTAAVRDLTARETECCSFFSFTVTPVEAADGEALTLDVQVPASHADVLASLAELAAAARGHRLDAVRGEIAAREREAARSGPGTAESSEYRCCSFGSYTLVIDGDGLRLEVRMPPEAAGTMAAVVGMPA